MNIPKPPRLEDLPLGNKLVAGMGYSTVIADIDFETYSEAGFIWDESKQSYQAPPNAKVKGLPTIGTAVYSEHPSTEVLCMAYDLKDGIGKRLWLPTEPFPLDLETHIKNWGLIEAWNVGFESWIWNNVCRDKYNFPEVQPWQWRCAAAKARAFALPGSLDAAGKVMDIIHKKDKDGKRLLNKFSMPRNPTKNDARRRIVPSLTSVEYEDTSKLYKYNLTDIAAEAELSSLIPDLSPEELEFWQCDQRINVRGVQIDLPMIRNCIAIVEQAHKKYNAELRLLTRGHVQSASEVAKIRAWLMERGVNAPTLDAEVVEQLLRTPGIHPDVKRILQIREMLASASVKKLYAMMNQVSKHGRLHDLFIYHVARTGRAAGAGPQPQNLPNSGPDVAQCLNCLKHYGVEAFGNLCPWCTNVLADKVEWNPLAVNNALETIASGNLECVEYYWGNAIEIISSCLRGMFISAPGKDLICSDYSAIEAVVLAALSGEQWRMDVFRTHGMIYETSASKITGINLQEYIRIKKDTGKHHADRKIGKVAELACFSRDTQVLTQRGYVGILDVLLTDTLWDGVEWVKHKGVINKGKREVIDLDGIRVTPNHPINLGGCWREAKLLASNENILCRALAIGSANLPSLPLKMKKFTFNALALMRPITLLFPILFVESLRGAMYALRKNPKQHIENLFGAIWMLCRTTTIGDDYAIGYLLQSPGAIKHPVNSMRIMAGEEYPYAINGEKINDNSSFMLKRCQVGIIKIYTWIVRTAIKVMDLETLGSLLNRKIISIKEVFKRCKKESSNLRTVYDIAHAGPRNRFTIKTNSGHLLVHNSGYQGWIGAWKAFGADSFMTEEQIKQAILAWRAASPAIVEFWGGQLKDWYPKMYGLEGAAVQAVLRPGTEYDCRGIKYIMRGDALYCRLLSGRYLVYHRPRLSPSQRKQDTFTLTFEGWNSNPKYGAPGWIRMETYGGKLTENVVQATARDLLAHAIIQLERVGYPVVLHIHDEIVVEVPEGEGSIEEVEKIMSTLPRWASRWPVVAKGGWRAKRYGK